MVDVLGNVCSEIDNYGHYKIHDFADHHLNWVENPIIGEGSVVLRTLGRLGNQLFQYAAAYSLAQQTESKLYVFVDFGTTDENILVNHLTQAVNKNPDRNYYLTDFILSKDTIFVPINQNTNALYKTFFRGYIKCDYNSVTLNGNTVDVICVDNNFDYNSISKIKNNKIIKMEDYFEDQKYFDPTYDAILKQFMISPPISKDIEAIVNEVSEENSVCINIRRLDMKLTPWYLPVDFQLRAINFIQELDLVKNPKYFIISDDIESVKEDLVDMENINYISGDHNLGLNGFNILLNCKNIIITKSTYAWWGAFLNRQEGFVIGPCDDQRDMYKHDSRMYKINYSLNGKIFCDFNYQVLYKENGENIYKTY